MEVWHIWLIFALICFIIEIFTQGFAIICFSFGCIAAAICAALHVDFLYQMVAFGAFSLLAFVLVRPVVLKYFVRTSEDTRTNTDALIGKRAIVSETIDPANHTGRVAIDGEDWKAISETNEMIEKGKTIVIIKQNSLVLIVKRI